METSEDSQKTYGLMTRISEMRKSIDALKLKIQLERNYIDQEKYKIQETQSQANWFTQKTPSTDLPPHLTRTCQSTAQISEYERTSKQQHDKVLLFPFSKQSLRDIDEKCETELMKLNRYIDSIKELKKFWRNATEANNCAGLTEATDTVQTLESERVFEGTPNYLKS